MSAFQAEWLRLREPCDHAARSASLAARFARALGPAPRLVDLGCGTGSNLRYLAPRLARAQQWLLVDHDPALLEQARSAIEPLALEARCRALDLARELPDLEGCTGITASALLDLTSAAWQQHLVRWCRGRPLLIALSFDGRLVWQPAADDDETVRQRFLAHQRTDKGFGPALGPDAAAHLAGLLEVQRLHVSLRTSDWRLGPADTPLLRALLGGILAAIERPPESWSALRQQQLAAGELRLTVGHVDLLALPG